MTTQKNWPLMITISAYWLILAFSLLAFAALFMAVGMTPGNYHMKTQEAAIFLLLPAALLGCKFIIYKLRRTPGGIKLLTFATVIPLVQILIVILLI